MKRVDLSRLRFLVVDDSENMRRISRTLLHGFGTRDVREAGNGPDALAVFNEYKPDILLTECAISVFDGLKLTRMIRQSEHSHNRFAPIIMVSIFTDKSLIAAARDAGVTELLAKPLTANALYQRIIHVCAHPRPFIRTSSYFGPDRRRNVKQDYDGPERRKSDNTPIANSQPLLDRISLPI